MDKTVTDKEESCKREFIFVTLCLSSLALDSIVSYAAVSVYFVSVLVNQGDRDLSGLV